MCLLGGEGWREARRIAPVGGARGGGNGGGTVLRKKKKKKKAAWLRWGGLMEDDAAEGWAGIRVYQVVLEGDRARY